jgi:hypothetical protein
MFSNNASSVPFASTNFFRNGELHNDLPQRRDLSTTGQVRFVVDRMSEGNFSCGAVASMASKARTIISELPTSCAGSCGTAWTRPCSHHSSITCMLMLALKLAGFFVQQPLCMPLLLQELYVVCMGFPCMQCQCK